MKANKLLFILFTVLVIPVTVRAANISIKIVFEGSQSQYTGFYYQFGSGREWSHLQNDIGDIESNIVARISADYSAYGISVSESSGNLTVYIGRSGEGFGYAASGIGSYIDGSAYAEVYSNTFGSYPQWQEDNATVSRIVEAVAGIASHEAGHLINLYHAYMFDSFDPTIPGALKSNYQPKEPDNLPSSCTTDLYRYQHLMATENYLTLEQRATLNRYFADNSDMILKFAKNGGYNVSRNITWGINNKTFYQEQDIIVQSGKTLYIASGGYNHHLNSKILRCEGTGKIKKEGSVSSYKHYAKSGSDYKGFFQASNTIQQIINWAYSGWEITIGSGTYSEHEDITVESGVELTIDDGTTVEFKPDKKLTIKGTLNAENVNFESTSAIAEWGGLVFDGSSSSSSELYECTIEDAIVGITITGSNAAPTIEKCLVQDCDSYPLKLTSDCTPNIYNNKFHAGNTHAVYISSADGDFSDNEFRTSSGTTYGVYVTGSSSNPDFDASAGNSGNLFDLSYIGSHGAYAAGGYPEFGDSGPHDGLNDFINRGSSKYIYNNTGSTVDAEVNYWGGTPQSSWFSGSVDYNPYESSSNDAGPTWKVLSNPYFVGSDMYEDGDYEDALAELKAALQQDSESANASGAVFKMAKSAVKLNRLADEESLLKNLLSSPNAEVRHMSRVWLVYLYAMQDQLEEAEKIAFQAPEGTRAQRAELLSLVGYHSNLGDEQSAQRIANLLREKFHDEYLEFDLEAAIETTYSFSKSLAKSKAELPTSFTLKNYPNPFNPSTTLKYNIPNTSDIQIDIYNTLGQKIKTYSINGQEPGTHQLNWYGKNSNGWNVPSGIYFVRFRATSLDNKKEVFEKSLKITLIR